MADLTPEQQFELKQRNMKPAELLDDPEMVTDTADSIKTAESIVGGKMAEPVAAADMEVTPVYKYHTADDEDEETRETRRSVKYVEKQLKQRFWINAKEKR